MGPTWEADVWGLVWRADVWGPIWRADVLAFSAVVLALTESGVLPENSRGTLFIETGGAARMMHVLSGRRAFRTGREGRVTARNAR